jgi:hypothetical protein
MTKLEELKANAEAADTAASDAWYDAHEDAWDAFEAAHGGALYAARNAAWTAYRAELKKVQEEKTNDC